MPQTLKIKGFVENIEKANQLTHNIDEEVILDFEGIRFCTQGFIHNLLFNLISNKVEFEVINATRTVIDMIDFVQKYLNKEQYIA